MEVKNLMHQSQFVCLLMVLLLLEAGENMHILSMMTNFNFFGGMGRTRVS